MARAAPQIPSSSAVIGDVLIAWESEALLAVRELGAGNFEIVTPCIGDNTAIQYVNFTNGPSIETRFLERFVE